MKAGKIWEIISTTMILVSFVFLAVLALNCSSKSNSVTGNETNKVTIQGNAFLPDSLEVSMGTTVTWTNLDSYAHTVTSGTPDAPTTLFDSGNISSNGTFSHTFNTTGSFVYHCKIHTYMRGKIIVQ
jgi:plastocyanin